MLFVYRRFRMLSGFYSHGFFGVFSPICFSFCTFSVVAYGLMALVLSLVLSFVFLVRCLFRSVFRSFFLPWCFFVALISFVLSLSLSVSLVRSLFNSRSFVFLLHVIYYVVSFFRWFFLSVFPSFCLSSFLPSMGSGSHSLSLSFFLSPLLKGANTTVWHHPRRPLGAHSHDPTNTRAAERAEVIVGTSRPRHSARQHQATGSEALSPGPHKLPQFVHSTWSRKNLPVAFP